jgi:hypothetical protein
MDNINKVFRPGDYTLDIRWFGLRDALETLLKIGSVLTSADPNLIVTSYQGETLEAFTWNRDSLQNALLDSVTRFLQLRGDDNRLDIDMIVFRTAVEGVDLLATLRIVDKKPPLIETISLDFLEEHLDPVAGIFSSDLLQELFTNSALASAPDYAVLGRTPAVTADWYWRTRINIDTEKVPVAFEWLNFFSWDWVQRMGEKKFDNCPVGEVKRLPNGVLYIMQNEPFSYSNPEHVQRQQRVNKHFELGKLHKKYARV